MTKMIGIRKGAALFAAAVMSLASTSTWAVQPIPQGSSTTTFSYESTTGVVSFSGTRDYTGIGLGSATILGNAANIRTFNSVNSFGRRTVVDNSHPEVIGPDESLISHAFFKIDINTEYFPNLSTNGNLTIAVDNIQFPEPVTIVPSTIMLHVLFNPNQVDMLLPIDGVYFNTHNHHIAPLLFRDIDAFKSANVLTDFPPGIGNHVLGDIEPIITGNGTTKLGISLTFPYNTLKHLEQNTQTAPPPLPAPQGFLEPFHFHLEYIVAKASCAETAIDSDGDNDIDLGDYAIFQRCLSGPQ